MTDTRNNPVSIGGADGWLVGYDQDHNPVAWREGEQAEPANDLADYNGWHLHRHGLDVAWCDLSGRLHRPDGEID